MDERTIIDERYTYPGAVQYRLVETGEIMNYPPNDGRVYRLIIHDVEAFNELSASGALTDPKHTGRKQKTIVDNRNATQ